MTDKLVKKLAESPTENNDMEALVKSPIGNDYLDKGLTIFNDEIVKLKNVGATKEEREVARETYISLAQMHFPNISDKKAGKIADKVLAKIEKNGLVDTLSEPLRRIGGRLNSSEKDRFHSLNRLEMKNMEII
jgi:hypothetical protein